MTIFYENKDNVQPIGDARDYNEIYSEIKKFCNQNKINYFYLREFDKGNRHYIVTEKKENGSFYYLIK